MKKFLSAALIVASLFAAPSAEAEVKNYDGVGVYVKSYSRAENLELVADEVETMTGSILKVLSVEFKTVPMEQYGGIMYRAIIVAEIDTANIDDWISRSLSRRESLVEQNRALQQQLDEQEKLIAELKKRAEQSNNPAANENLQRDFAQADKLFMSNVKLEEGNRYVLLNADWAYDKAYESWSEAIELNPDNAENFHYRGVCLPESGDVDAAKEDFLRALELKPDMSSALGELAFIYASRDPLSAIDYAERALELDERNWRALYSCGLALYNMHNYEMALEDGLRALELGCGDAYQLIGDCYGMLGHRDEAEKYWQLAVERPAFG